MNKKKHLIWKITTLITTILGLALLYSSSTTDRWANALAEIGGLLIAGSIISWVSIIVTKIIKDWRKIKRWFR